MMKILQKQSETAYCLHSVYSYMRYINQALKYKLKQNY